MTDDEYKTMLAARLAQWATEVDFDAASLSDLAGLHNSLVLHGWLPSTAERRAARGDVSETQVSGGDVLAQAVEELAGLLETHEDNER